MNKPSFGAKNFGCLYSVKKSIAIIKKITGNQTLAINVGKTRVTVKKTGFESSRLDETRTQATRFQHWILAPLLSVPWAQDNGSLKLPSPKLKIEYGATFTYLVEPVMVGWLLQTRLQDSKKIGYKPFEDRSQLPTQLRPRV